MEVRSFRNKYPDPYHQPNDDGNIEEEDILPAKLLYDDSAIKRADNSAGFCHRSDDTKGQGTPPLSIEVACDGHSHRHQRTTTNGLNETGCDQPDQSRRRGINVDRAQEAQVPHLPKYGCQATENGANTEDAQAQ